MYIFNMDVRSRRRYTVPRQTIWRDTLRQRGEERDVQLVQRAYFMLNAVNKKRGHR